jgi:hypothetical protein
VFIFEMAMTMATKALAQVDTASAMVDPTIDRFAEASSLLKGAASICMALSQVLFVVFYRYLAQLLYAGQSIWRPSSASIVNGCHYRCGAA